MKCYRNQWKRMEDRKVPVVLIKRLSDQLIKYYENLGIKSEACRLQKERKRILNFTETVRTPKPVTPASSALWHEYRKKREIFLKKKKLLDEKNKICELSKKNIFPLESCCSSLPGASREENTSSAFKWPSTPSNTYQANSGCTSLVSNIPAINGKMISSTEVIKRKNSEDPPPPEKKKWESWNLPAGTCLSVQENLPSSESSMTTKHITITTSDDNAKNNTTNVLRIPEQSSLLKCLNVNESSSASSNVKDTRQGRTCEDSITLFKKDAEAIALPEHISIFKIESNKCDSLSKPLLKPDIQLSKLPGLTITTVNSTKIEQVSSKSEDEEKSLKDKDTTEQERSFNELEKLIDSLSSFSGTTLTPVSGDNTSKLGKPEGNESNTANTLSQEDLSDVNNVHQADEVKNNFVNKTLRDVCNTTEALCLPDSIQISTSVSLLKYQSTDSSLDAEKDCSGKTSIEIVKNTVNTDNQTHSASDTLAKNSEELNKFDYVGQIMQGMDSSLPFHSKKGATHEDTSVTFASSSSANTLSDCKSLGTLSPTVVWISKNSASLFDGKGMVISTDNIAEQLDALKNVSNAISTDEQSENNVPSILQQIHINEDQDLDIKTDCNALKVDTKGQKPLSCNSETVSDSKIEKVDDSSSKTICRIIEKSLYGKNVFKRKFLRKHGYFVSGHKKVAQKFLKTIAVNNNKKKTPILFERKMKKYIGKLSPYEQRRLTYKKQKTKQLIELKCVETKSFEHIKRRLDDSRAHLEKLKKKKIELPSPEKMEEEENSNLSCSQDTLVGVASEPNENTETSSHCSTDSFHVKDETNIDLEIKQLNTSVSESDDQGSQVSKEKIVDETKIPVIADTKSANEDVKTSVLDVSEFDSSISDIKAKEEKTLEQNDSSDLFFLKYTEADEELGLEETQDTLESPTCNLQEQTSSQLPLLPSGEPVKIKLEPPDEEFEKKYSKTCDDTDSKDWHKQLLNHTTTCSGTPFIKTEPPTADADHNQDTCEIPPEGLNLLDSFKSLDEGSTQLSTILTKSLLYRKAFLELDAYTALSILDLEKNGQQSQSILHHFIRREINEFKTLRETDILSLNSNAQFQLKQKRQHKAERIKVLQLAIALLKKWNQSLPDLSNGLENLFDLNPKEDSTKLNTSSQDSEKESLPQIGESKSVKRSLSTDCEILEEQVKKLASEDTTGSGKSTPSQPEVQILDVKGNIPDMGSDVNKNTSGSDLEKGKSILGILSERITAFIQEKSSAQTMDSLTQLDSVHQKVNPSHTLSSSLQSLDSSTRKQETSHSAFANTTNPSQNSSMGKESPEVLCLTPPTTLSSSPGGVGRPNVIVSSPQQNNTSHINMRQTSTMSSYGMPLSNVHHSSNLSNLHQYGGSHTIQHYSSSTTSGSSANYTLPTVGNSTSSYNIAAPVQRISHHGNTEVRPMMNVNSNYVRSSPNHHQQGIGRVQHGLQYTPVNQMQKTALPAQVEKVHQPQSRESSLMKQASPVQNTVTSRSTHPQQVLIGNSSVSNVQASQANVTNRQLGSMMPLSSNHGVRYSPGTSGMTTAQNSSNFQRQQNMGGQKVGVSNPAQAPLHGATCALCGKPSTLKCKRCSRVSYCSVQCAKVFWHKGHRYECR